MLLVNVFFFVFARIFLWFIFLAHLRLKKLIHFPLRISRFCKVSLFIIMVHHFDAGKDFIMNNITLSGTLDSELTVAHQTVSDIFYQTVLSVKKGVDRNTGEDIFDHIPLMVSSYALAPFRGKIPEKGAMVKAEGELRLAVYLDSSGETRTQELYILVTDLIPLRENVIYENHVVVTGQIIRPARYSSGYTTEGRIQESSSLSIAVPFGRGNRFVYVTILSNGRAARATRYYVKGDTLKISGHIRLEDRDVPSNSTGEITKRRIGYLIARNMQVLDYAPDEPEEVVDDPSGSTPLAEEIEDVDIRSSEHANDEETESSFSDIAIPDLD